MVTPYLLPHLPKLEPPEQFIPRRPGGTVAAADEQSSILHLFAVPFTQGKYKLPWGREIYPVTRLVSLE